MRESCLRDILLGSLIGACVLGYTDASYAVSPSYSPRLEQTIDTDNGGGGPLICADNQGHIYIVFGRCQQPCTGAEGDVRLVRSSDFGRSWESPRTIESIPGLAQVSGGSSDLAADDHGRVYLVWPNHHVEGEVVGNTDIYFAKSNDFGLNWNAPSRISTTSPGQIDYGLPRLFHDELGNLYVTYHDGGGVSGVPAPYLNVSNDGGETWLQNQVRVDDVAADAASGARITGDSLGHVYLLYTTRTGSVFDVYFRTSEDFGATLLPSIKLSDGPNRGSMFCSDGRGGVLIGLVTDDQDLVSRKSSDFGVSFSEPSSPINAAAGSITVAHGIELECGQRAYALWTDSRSGTSVLYFNRSIDGGNTWDNSDTMISGSPTDEESFVATAGEHLYVAWLEFGGAVKVSVSCDSGLTWSGEMRVNSVSDSSQPKLAADDRGNCYVTWDVLTPRSKRFTTVEPVIGLGISAFESPVRVPPGGLTFDYDLWVSNRSTETVAGLTALLDATTPDGNRTAPFIGPRVVSLPPLFEREKTLRMRIPGRVSPGEYLISLRVDGPITDQNHMCIIKE